MNASATGYTRIDINFYRDLQGLILGGHFHWITRSINDYLPLFLLDVAKENKEIKTADLNMQRKSKKKKAHASLT